MLTVEQRSAYINTIRVFPGELEKLIDGLTAEQLTTPYIDGEWTIAQIVHHMVDSHANSYLRLKLILTADRPAMQSFDEGAVAMLPDGVEADMQHSLAVLHGLHHRWVIMWESLTDEQWQRVGLVRGTKEITPEYLVENYANHCRNHLEQIQGIMKAALM